MACCIFAAFIMAQISLTLRRWGRFWGVVPKTQETEDVVTLGERMNQYLSRPSVRWVIAGIIGIESIALGVWLWVDHSHHLLHLTHSVRHLFSV